MVRRSNLGFSSDAEPEEFGGELNNLQCFVVAVIGRTDVRDHASTAAGGATTQRVSNELRQLALPATRNRRLRRYRPSHDHNHNYVRNTRNVRFRSAHF